MIDDSDGRGWDAAMLNSKLVCERGATLLCAMAACVVVGGCGDGAFSDDADGGLGDGSVSGARIEEQRAAFFEREHLIEVEAELDPADWEALRNEGRSLPDVFSGCERDFAYTDFEGEVTVDGDHYGRVVVRKKGYLGSLSVGRPSLKLNFGKLQEGRTHAGMTRITLNNDRQDPSHTHQCQAYDMFAAAGSVAPRCNYAHVVVNGEDLGIYTHVESIKKPMLRRHFDDDDGNLYEGQGGDFTEVRKELLQLKTNESEDDRSDIDRVIAALDADDDALLEALGAVVDIDAFLTFWVMEVMVGHWDSYSGGTNNFVTYHDPTTDRFFFIPWGTDGAFSQQRVFSPDNTAVTVLAEGWVANRLYNHPEGRRMYFERFEQLFAEVWDEDALVEQAAWIGGFTDAPPGSIAAQQQQIRELGAGIRAELGRTPAEWIGSPAEDTELMCYADYPQPISGTFSTTWGPQAPVAGQTLDVAVPGWDISTLLGSADVDDADPDRASILIMSPRADGKVVVLVLSMPRASVASGVHPMHGFETNGVLVEVDPSSTADFRLLGFVGGGTITLDEAGTERGDAVKGSFEGELVLIAAL